MKHQVVAADGDTVEIFWQRSTQTIAQLPVGPSWPHDGSPAPRAPQALHDLIERLVERWRQEAHANRIALATIGLHRRVPAWEWDALKRTEAHADELAALLAPRPEQEERPPDTYPWGETMPQHATLGIGAEAWVELEEIERRGKAHRNDKRSGMSISWGTFTLVMSVLRAIRIEDFHKRAAAPRPGAEQADEQ